MAESDEGLDALRARLTEETVMARSRVYRVRAPTPLETIDLGKGAALHLKREDVPPMYAYKWRGAINKLAKMSQAGGDVHAVAGGDVHVVAGGDVHVVAASAGNHAQGVAIGASRLGMRATIFMPLPTPRMKQLAVARLGGDCVDVRLVGDTFDVSMAAAREFAAAERAELVHPFDDIDIMAGQATLADEVVLAGIERIDTAYLQIGGGGMAAGVANWLRVFYPGVRIVGVEGVDQASMQAALASGGPCSIDYVDVFCDGTAVRRAGELTYRLCAGLIDSFMTVTNSEVCAAMQYLWETRRILAEPAGAMGVAAWRRESAGGSPPPGNSLAVVCGANMDFAQLSNIVRQAAIGSAERRFVRFAVGERAGTLYQLVRELRATANIVDFQYGKTNPDTGYPVIGFDIHAPDWRRVCDAWRDRGYAFEEVTGEPDIDFRVIPYNPALIQRPVFLEVEFPERAGALSDFLQAVHEFASICYFNYLYTGERVGRAVLGFEFESQDASDRLHRLLGQGGHSLRSARELPPGARERMLGHR